MEKAFDPTFEYEREAVLWAGFATIVLSAAVMFVIDRPSWILPIAFIAGCIAAARGGFYDSHANNGLLGVVLAIVPLNLLAFLYRGLLFAEPVTDPDTIFLASTLALVDLLAYIPLMMIMGYLGGIVADFVRRRTDGPIGY